MRLLKALCLVLSLAGAVLVGAGCGAAEPDLVVYSGRAEPLIKPFIDRFERQEDLEIDVRYGSTASLTSTLVEEGEETSADMFIAQDAAAMVQLDREDLLQPYSGVLKAPERYRAEDETWTGLAGSVRALAVRAEDPAPESVFSLSARRYAGELVAPVPTNGPFRDWVSAIRVVRGERFARRYLERLDANDVQPLPSDLDAAGAVDRGEFDIGLVNNSDVELAAEEGGAVKAVYTDQEKGGFGVLLNFTSAGITASSQNLTNARRLMDYLLEESVQRRLTRASFEYPVLPGVTAAPGVRPLADLRTTPVSLDRLGGEADETEKLLERVGLGQ